MVFMKKTEKNIVLDNFVNHNQNRKTDHSGKDKWSPNHIIDCKGLRFNVWNTSNKYNLNTRL